MKTENRWWSIGVHRWQSRFTAQRVETRWVLFDGGISWSRDDQYSVWKMNFSARAILASVMMGSPRPKMSCEGTARWSLRLSEVAPARSATSLQRFRPSKTKSFARPSQAFWSCKVVLAPERPLSHFIVRRICCTPIAFHSKTKACW